MEKKPVAIMPTAQNPWARWPRAKMPRATRSWPDSDWPMATWIQGNPIQVALVRHSKPVAAGGVDGGSEDTGGKLCGAGEKIANPFQTP